MSFRITAEEVRAYREQHECGLEEARAVLKKKEALRRLENMRQWGDHDAVILEFLTDLVEELM